MKIILGLFLIAFCLDACNDQGTKTATTTDTTVASWAMVPFEKVDSVNPVLLPGQNTFTDPILHKQVGWDAKDVFNPAAVIRDGEVYLIFRAEDSIGRYKGTSRIGLAVSEDGYHFKKLPEPVLYPANDSMKKYEWEGGIEDPRVVQDSSGRYIMTYTAYDGKTARLCVAVSDDLHHWQKKGLAFGKAGNGKYVDLWSKSGAILCRQKGSSIVAQRLNGKYWMYWGDKSICLATSDDLINWTPLTNNGAIEAVIKPRSKHFDSGIVESGPFALLKDNNILLIYNSMNNKSNGDKALADHAYSGGQVLLSENKPDSIISRLEHNFIRPDKPYEINGQVNEVCFLEGLVPFHKKWFLYYGTADSKIAVAVHSIGDGQD